METNIDNLESDVKATQQSLVEKLEKLEEKVTDTVENTTNAVSDAVSGTVESVQDTVEAVTEKVTEKMEEAVASVKRNFDIRYQVDQRPWVMIGASVLVGYIAGRAIHSAAPKIANRLRLDPEERRHLVQKILNDSNIQADLARDARAAVRPEDPNSIWNQAKNALGEIVHEGISNLRSAALTASRQMASEAVSSLVQNFQQPFQNAMAGKTETPESHRPDPHSPEHPSPGTIYGRPTI